MTLPKDVYLLLPGTCEYVPLLVIRDFTGGFQLRTWRWGDCLDGLNLITVVLKSG